LYCNVLTCKQTTRKTPFSTDSLLLQTLVETLNFADTEEQKRITNLISKGLEKALRNDFKLSIWFLYFLSSLLLLLFNLLTELPGEIRAQAEQWGEHEEHVVEEGEGFSCCVNQQGFNPAYLRFRLHITGFVTVSYIKNS